MIRRRDRVRLSIQKLALRKKRALFAIISVALGIIPVVTLDSLMKGVRDVVVNTPWTEEIHAEVIKVNAERNPYEYLVTTEERQQAEKKRTRFLSESVFEEIRNWPDVDAADHPVVVDTLSVDAFEDQPRPITRLKGVPELLLLRYVERSARLNGCSNAIPLVVGERHVRLYYDPDRKKLELAPEDKAQTWIDREVTVLLGDNYAQAPRYDHDYEKGEYEELAEQEIAAHRESLERKHRSRYDMTIFNTTLPLKGRIVGLCPGNDVLIPVKTAVQCQKWIEQRNQLASLRPSSRSQSATYGRRGRQTPLKGEYTAGLVLVKEGTDTEEVAARIEEMGFYVQTRQRTFESQAQMFDSGLRVVKKVVLAIGALVLVIACGLIWSTTSRIVSDSRADIGLYRALGATKRNIKQLFLSESVLLGLLGTLMGLLLGWALAMGIDRWVIDFARREVVDPEEALLIPDTIFAFNIKFCLLLFAGAAIVSLLAGLLPASRAARIDPVKALKRE